MKVTEWTNRVLDNHTVRNGKYGERLMLLCLSMFADNDGQCSPSLEQLGEVANTSHRGTYEAVRILLEQGAIEIAAPAAGRKPTTYRITV